ncbi:hypothetical protein E4U13_007016 [Claviceps humidiphila]|uniref:Uncharacterized protein n=1 Tax=Claviceps humidiphila TaxID=1294629 RepID=A0A9P7Q663_9HYPO|nr:hypothetical protein E4U13_007016 [Claviceps humidiphila]
MTSRQDGVLLASLSSQRASCRANPKDLTPSPSSPSPWQAEVITIEDDAAPADPITIDDDTESDCDLQQKEVNLENIEKMKVEKTILTAMTRALSASEPFHKTRCSLRS